MSDFSFNFERKINYGFRALSKKDIHTHMYFQYLTNTNRLYTRIRFLILI